MFCMISKPISDFFLMNFSYLPRHTEDPCDHFQWKNQNMILMNTEFSETTHSIYKMSKRIQKFEISRKFGTLVHQKRALVWHNSKRTGFVSL